MDVEKLERGELVVAVKDLAEVKAGTLGVVYEQAGFYDVDAGPMVRWFNGSAFEVYEGDVALPDEA
jgi:hypothetical protein